MVDGAKSSTYYYVGEYEEFEILGILDAGVNDKISLRFTGDYVNNTGADSLNTAYLFGGTLDYGKDRGLLKLFANYRAIEADAVIGVFTSSNLARGRHERQGLGARLGNRPRKERKPRPDVSPQQEGPSRRANRSSTTRGSRWTSRPSSRRASPDSGRLPRGSLRAETRRGSDHPGGRFNRNLTFP